MSRAADSKTTTKRRSRTCTWAQDWDANEWDSSCGHSFVLDDGTPSENKMGFCCFCGRELKEVIHAEEA